MYSSNPIYSLTVRVGSFFSRESNDQESCAIYWTSINFYFDQFNVWKFRDFGSFHFLCTVYTVHLVRIFIFSFPTQKFPCFLRPGNICQNLQRISVAAAADLISNQAAGIGATFREKVNLFGPVVCQTIQKTIWRSHV